MRKGLILAAVAAAFLIGAWAAEKTDAADIGPNPPEWDPQQVPPIRQVEVVNFPNPQAVTGTVDLGNLPAVLQVEVVNPLGASPRFQLVGFTAATVIGNVGTFGMTTTCQTEFAGSRMCGLGEALKTTNVPSLVVGTDDAWIDPENNASSAQGNCYGWSAGNSGPRGTTLTKTGVWVTRNCGNARSVACCAPVE